MIEPNDSGRSKEKRSSRISWLLVEAKCKQLAEAVLSARIPFLLALAWSFAWAWGLYSVGMGYTKLYYDRQVKLQTLSDTPIFKEACRSWFPFDGAGSNRVTVAGQRYEVHDERVQRFCKELVAQRIKFASESYLESQIVSLPWGMGRLHISDLGIMGNLGSLLLLVWTFFAVRRENHAVMSFVELSPEDVRAGRCLPSSFVLIPKDEYLSAEHYAFAYQSVAQRFLFILSNFSRPLLSLTLTLLAAPFLVSLINLLSDVHSLYNNPLLLETAIWARLTVEIVLVGIVLYCTLKIMRISIGTSILLNGWHLAVRDVWIHEWDERTTYPASRVRIDFTRQTAELDKATTSGPPYDWTPPGGGGVPAQPVIG